MSIVLDFPKELIIHIIRLYVPVKIILQDNTMYWVIAGHEGHPCLRPIMSHSILKKCGITLDPEEWEDLLLNVIQVYVVQFDAVQVPIMEQKYTVQPEFFQYLETRLAETSVKVLSKEWSGIWNSMQEWHIKLDQLEKSYRQQHQHNHHPNKETDTEQSLKNDYKSFLKIGLPLLKYSIDRRSSVFPAVSSVIPTVSSVKTIQ